MEMYKDAPNNFSSISTTSPLRPVLSKSAQLDLAVG